MVTCMKAQLHRRFDFGTSTESFWSGGDKGMTQADIHQWNHSEIGKATRKSTRGGHFTSRLIIGPCSSDLSNTHTKLPPQLRQAVWPFEHQSQLILGWHLPLKALHQLSAPRIALVEHLGATTLFRHWESFLIRRDQAGASGSECESEVEGPVVYNEWDWSTRRRWMLISQDRKLREI